MSSLEIFLIGSLWGSLMFVAGWFGGRRDYERDTKETLDEIISVIEGIEEELERIAEDR